MEKFYLCNFLGNSLKRRNYKGITKVEVSKDVELSTEVGAYIDGNTLVFSADNKRGKAFDFIGGFNTSDEKYHCTEEELHGTDENPIVVVITKSFKVYKDVPAYIKYIPIEGGVVVALLKGVIAVQYDNGEYVQLARNTYANTVLAESQVYTADDIANMNVLEDKESGVKYSDYVVSDCVIFISLSKDNRILKKVKFSKENFNVLSQEVFDEGKAKKERIARKQEEEKLAKEEQRRQYYEKMRKQKELDEVAANEGFETSGNKKVKVTEGSTGAQEFLNFVNSLRG